MRWRSWLPFTLLLVLSVAPPALARLATIETTAPLQNHAEQSIKTAFKEAVETAVRGAVAMGLYWVKINRALVLEDMVTVQIIATDTASQEEQSRPGGEPGVWSAQSAGRTCEGFAAVGFRDRSEPGPEVTGPIRAESRKIEPKER